MNSNEKKSKKEQKKNNLRKKLVRVAAKQVFDLLSG